MIQTVPSNYDIIFLGIIVLSTIMALFRGAVAEILSLAVWVGAFWIMRNYGILISDHLPEPIPHNMLLRDIIIFILIFIAVALIAKIIKLLTASLIKGIGLGGLNFAIGIIFGALRGIFICSILIILISMFKLDPKSSYEKAKVYPLLKPCIHWIASSVPQKLVV